MHVYRVRIAGHNADGSDRYFGVFDAEAFGQRYVRLALVNALFTSRKVNAECAAAVEFVNGAMALVNGDAIEHPTFYGNVFIESFPDDDNVYTIPGRYDCHHCGKPMGH